ncbi:thiamine-phosphate kinase [Hyphomonas sp.]|uniref:thiamine-phosphate kinase n=1 Tax=Hyphomonas sp. TaxID=87 RepID=UPI00391C0A0C
MAEKDWIRRYFAPLVRSAGAAGLTDDTAELSPANGPVVITTDAMVEGVHFFPDDPVETIARKLVRVNVSDILASGAEPREALLTLGWPAEGRSEAELAAFAAALGDELSQWGADLIGGDTVVSPSGLFLSLTLTGACLGPAPICRGGASAGDDVWVTGEIGAARRGYLWKTTGQGEAGWLAALRLPSLPPLSAAALLAREASAAMDISDGLLGDLAALAAASGLAAMIELSAVPFAGGAESLDQAVDLASWGDDYQLLFTAPPAARLAIEASGIPASRIGSLVKGQGLAARWQDAPVNLPETLAFEHGRHA